MFFFVSSNFPGADITYYDSIDACLKAVLDGKAGCTTLNGMRANNILKNRKYRDLTIMQQNAVDDRCFGVELGNEGLLKLLNRGINIVGTNKIQNLALEYSDELYTYNLADTLLDNMWFVALLVFVVAVIFVSILLRETVSNKKLANEREAAAKVLEEKNAQLGEAVRVAEHANKAKDNFLSAMSHDIRTPMNAILSMNEMILRESSDEKILEYSGHIQSSGKTLIGLINDILDFSKIGAGKLDIIPVDYQLSSVLNELVNIAQSMAEEKGLELKIDVDPALPNHLKGDEIRIKQAVTNILSNAVKYTKEGTITFGLGFETVPEDESSVLLKFSVKDTGVGIKKENVSKLFEAFERLDKIENRSIEGTGLGIPITQSLLRLMGSTLEVESEYGVGSTFSFALKQEVKNWEGVGDFEKSFIKGITGRRTYREKFIAPDAKILVVDDAPVNLTVFKNLLKATKMQIDSAGSADECIEMTKKSKYDMIFLDHMMPEKDGIEALREIKAMADNPNIETPAVCLTANAISGMREMYLAEGFDDYLTKPIDSGDLEECIIRHLTLEKILPPVTKKGYISDKIVVNLPKQLSVEDLTEIFKKLRNLLDNNDYNEVAAIGKMLGNSDIPESEKQRVEMIRSAISNFDYDDVYNFI